MWRASFKVAWIGLEAKAGRRESTLNCAWRSRWISGQIAAEVSPLTVRMSVGDCRA